MSSIMSLKCASLGNLYWYTLTTKSNSTLTKELHLQAIFMLIHRFHCKRGLESSSLLKT